ncbi:phosphoribosylformylglycinamidine cyclo-ligase [Liquorilactobacillus sicerae]|uniref:phosphoribosylformylglycinamidine cyclo-ligase n=1 Tax=Liquorilactobacillus sicerae TaxID=1416943 RepID=UPI002480EE08|nr:phosphoribosylformylglycinamidine cyclo-ligase [Liquorilactobacillus sicerae]
MDRYQQAGVNVEAGYELVKRIKQDVASTARPGVLGQLGSFGGLFDLSALKIKDPILVSGTDGVGTKLLIAQEADQHQTIGVDCVAMCVNDVLAQGAQPLFFLDYIATGHNQPEKLAAIVKGVAAGCRQAKTALIGGETAEMPDMYAPDEYDLAGFAVGIAAKDQLLTAQLPQAGNVLLGLPSSGLHSNGYSLVRQILFKDHHLALNDRPAELNGQSLAQVLLTPTRIYVQAVRPLLEQNLVKGISHITGGGFYENLPRMFNDQLQAVINPDSWPRLPIFSYLQKLGQLTETDAFKTFNSGIGMVLAISAEQVKKVQQQLKANGEKSYLIGKLRQRPANQAKIVIKRG